MALDKGQKKQLEQIIQRRKAGKFWTENGDYISYGDSIATSDDMEEVLKSRLSGQTTRGKLFKDAEGAPQHIASVLSSIALSAPEALKARGNQNRSHVWHITGSAGAGKSINSNILFENLNALFLHSALQLKQGRSRDELTKEIAKYSKELLDPLHKAAGLDVDHNKWANDFVSGVEDLMKSPDAPILEKISDIPQKTTFKDIRGLLSTTQAYPTPTEKPGIAAVRRVLPELPFTVVDDLFSTAPRQDVGTYTNLFTIFGDKGVPTSSAIFTHNVDEAFLNKFADTFATEGTAGRMGIFTKVGVAGENWIRQSMSTAHGMALDKVSLGILGDLTSSSPEAEDRIKSLLNSSPQKRRKDISSALASVKDEIGKLDKKYDGKISDTLNVINSLSPDELHAILKSQSKGDRINSLREAFFGALADDGVSEQDIRTLDSLLNNIDSSVGLNSKSGGQIPKGSGFGNAFEDAKKRLSGEMSGDEFAKKYKVNMSGPESTLSSEEQKKVDNLTKELQKDFNRLSKHIDFDELENLVSHDRSKLINGYDSYGFGEMQNNNHICKIVNNAELGKNKNLVKLASDESGNRHLVLDRKAFDSRFMRQLKETLNSIDKYVKDPEKARKYKRDFIFSNFGFTPSAHVLNKYFGLYGQASKQFEGMRDVLTHYKFDRDLVTNEKKAFNQAVEAIQAMATAKGSENRTPEVIANELRDTFKRSLKPDGDVDQESLDYLDSTANFLDFVHNNHEQLRDYIRKNVKDKKERLHALQTLEALQGLKDQKFEVSPPSEKELEKLNEYRKKEICPQVKGNDKFVDDFMTKHSVSDSSQSNFAKSLSSASVLRRFGLS